MAVENKNYLDKIVNVYIAYDLDSWSRNQVKTFRRKPYLFGTTAIVKPSDKSDKTHQANMCLWNTVNIPMIYSTGYLEGIPYETLGNIPK